MVLNDLMEEKQLNFNQPLLSVRRGSGSLTPAPAQNEKNAYNSRPSLPPLPYYKSDLKSGPIRNPGVVPFKWECMPGRPKDENKAQKYALKSQPLTPKLPPGRTANHMQKQADEVLRNSPISSSIYRAENNFQSLESSSPDKFILEVEESEKEKEDKDICSSEDENVTYVDAQETLSRSESFYNCSVSGVSGLDGPESSGVFPDPQTRDFMMDRYLPAAKAVASETPHFTSRRHPVAREQEKPITQVVKLKRSPQSFGIPDTLPSKIDGKDEEEDEGDDESDGQEDLSVKLCGLMPRFCMINPIPGIKDHAEVVSSVRSVRTKPSFAHARRDTKHRDGMRNNRGDLKRSAYQYTTDLIHESLMNGHLGHYGMTKQKNASPQMFQDKEKQFLGLPGEPKNSSNLRNNGNTKLQLDSEEQTCLLESTEAKTLHMNSEKSVRSRHSHSSSSESRGTNPSVDYSLQEIMSLCCADEKVLPQGQNSGTTDPSAFATSEKSFHDDKEGVKKLQKHDEDVNLIVDRKKPLKPKVKSIGLTENGSSALALPPFLPKSPSESWLSRTLPSMSSRNPSSKSYLANHAFRASPVDPKRERLLTNLNMQNMLFQSPGELAPISEN